ncbi:hypothetical protein [Cellulomonas olei]|uniref:hypothetical protein n=1 Tax=Cellulomonas sp. P4 TaxID=3142533 RepID=UPI0031BA8D00
MAGRGPAPKPASKRSRRNATIALKQLPAIGRQGRAPKFPLPDDPRLTGLLPYLEERAAKLRDEWAEEKDGRKVRRLADRLAAAEREIATLRAEIAALAALERTIWRQLWATPMATQWEKLRWTRDVAQYTRHKAAAELGSIKDAKEARQFSDRLGLTDLALLRLRWEVAPPVAPTGEGLAGVTSLDDVRSVLD